eukprot:Nk52_evm1s1044 gene=Nk52_evmTU1s1044
MPLLKANDRLLRKADELRNVFTNGMHFAASHGLKDSLAVFIEHGVDVNARAEYGLTPLIESAHHGSQSCLLLLLEHNADINLADDIGETALHHAAMNGNLSCLNVLIKSGARIDDVNKYGTASTHMASMRGHAGCLKALLQAGAKSDAEDAHKVTPTHCAAYFGHLDCLKLLCEYRKKNLSNEFRWLSKRMYGSSDGITPAHNAVHNGQLETLKYLICHEGIDVDSCTDVGRNSLLHSVRAHIHSAGKIIYCGANATAGPLEIKHDDRKPCPFYQCCAFLISLGIKPSGKNNNGLRPSEKLSNEGCECSVVKLLEEHERSNTPSSLESTCMRYLLSNSNIQRYLSNEVRKTSHSSRKKKPKYSSRVVPEDCHPNERLFADEHRSLLSRLKRTSSSTANSDLNTLVHPYFPLPEILKRKFLCL